MLIRFFRLMYRCLSDGKLAIIFNLDYFGRETHGFQIDFWRQSLSRQLVDISTIRFIFRIHFREIEFNGRWLKTERWRILTQTKCTRQTLQNHNSMRPSRRLDALVPYTRRDHELYPLPSHRNRCRHLRNRIGRHWFVLVQRSLCPLLIPANSVQHYYLMKKLWTMMKSHFNWHKRSGRQQKRLCRNSLIVC